MVMHCDQVEYVRVTEIILLLGSVSIHVLFLRCTKDKSSNIIIFLSLLNVTALTAACVGIYVTQYARRLNQQYILLVNASTCLSALLGAHCRLKQP